MVHPPPGRILSGGSSRLSFVAALLLAWGELASKGSVQERRPFEVLSGLDD
ncbi:MAG: hypothetical protein R3F14_45115 [Polyangiaceae bacterium]